MISSVQKKIGLVLSIAEQEQKITSSNNLTTFSKHFSEVCRCTVNVEGNNSEGIYKLI